MGFQFFLSSILLGIGLAMDACAVSMANGMKEAKMSWKKCLIISFLFGFFQAAMPMIGYFVGHAFLSYIEKFIPWIALFLLGFLGGKMLWENRKNKIEEQDAQKLTWKVILMQAIATSIDALSVGVTFADYTVEMALVAVVMIAIVTFAICVGATQIGKKFGTLFGRAAGWIGGIILIGIGLEIFISGMFF